MYFREHLVLMSPSAAITNRMRQRKAEPKLTCADALPTSVPSLLDLGLRAGCDHIKEGDVVLIRADDKAAWEGSSDRWFAYVQNVRDDKLDILWLYGARDTTIGEAYSPFQNELFLSDNCACGRHACSKAAVIGTVRITWRATNPASIKGHFVRQKFRTALEEDKHDFVALADSDFACRCGEKICPFEDCLRGYVLGDTVLVRLRGNGLEPVQILYYFDEARRKVQIRIFERKLKMSNELNPTKDSTCISPSAIIRKCTVQGFGPEETVPFPFNQHGAGDFYFYRREESPLTNETPAFTPKWTPRVGSLTGLSMFCGGGNFDRGQEEGGTFRFGHAIDLSEHALHTHRANLPVDTNANEVNRFLGSVNDYLALALQGSDNSAEIGEISVISAGSPCPGFSRMQPDKQSEQSKQNASLVASVMSFVDVYAPLYLIFENVTAMGECLNKAEDQNVFAQTLATPVALGYQVQQFLMESWSYSSSQQRQRLFIGDCTWVGTIWTATTHARSPSESVHNRRCSTKDVFG